MTRLKNSSDDYDEFIIYCSRCHKDISNSGKPIYLAHGGYYVSKSQTNANLSDPDVFPEFDKAGENDFCLEGVRLCQKCHQELIVAYEAWKNSVNPRKFPDDHDCCICNDSLQEMEGKKYFISICLFFSVLEETKVQKGEYAMDTCFIACPKCFNKFMQHGVNLFVIYGFRKIYESLEKTYHELGDTRKFPLY